MLPCFLPQEKKSPLAYILVAKGNLYIVMLDRLGVG